MKLVFLLTFCLTSICCMSFAQARIQSNNPYRKGYVTDTAVSTRHICIIQGKNIKFEAITGILPVKDDEGILLGGLSYTYYKRSKTKDVSRPIVFLFNGGPGCSSMYLHIGGYAGPRVANLAPTGLPVLPYGSIKNDFSILDIADLVYVDPLETGYSKLLSDPIPGDVNFFNVQGDIKYLADWIHLFLSKYDRWLSPKYLVGESYGSIRVAGLAKALQDQHEVYANGVICISSILTLQNVVDRLINKCLSIPDYACAAWDKGLQDSAFQSQTREVMLHNAQMFVSEEFVPALVRTETIDDAKREYLAKSISSFTGISIDKILNNNLLVDTLELKAVLRSEPVLGESSLYTFEDLKELTLYQQSIITSGNEDSIYIRAVRAKEYATSILLPRQCKAKFGIGTTVNLCQKGSPTLRQSFPNTSYGYSSTQYWISQTWPAGGIYSQSLSAAFDDYLANNLCFKLNFPYKKLNLGTRPWAGEYHLVTDELRVAIETNPLLHILFQTGYYDGPPLEKDMQMWSLDPIGKYKDRLAHKTYKSGHVMYISTAVRKEVNQDIRDFILQSSQTKWK